MGISSGVACAADLVVGAEGDVRTLAVDVGDDGTGVGVEAELCTGIADVRHDLADDLLKIDVAVGGDLAHNVDEAGGCTGLAGHAGVGVVGQDLIEDGVGDLVTDLVGMALGDGLGRKQTILCHFCTSLALGCVLLLTASYTFIKLMQQKNALNRSSERLHSYLSVSRRIWHLMLTHRLSGFTGPVPSAALDKSVFSLSG